MKRSHAKWIAAGIAAGFGSLLVAAAWAQQSPYAPSSRSAPARTSAAGVASAGDSMVVDPNVQPAAFAPLFRRASPCPPGYMPVYPGAPTVAVPPVVPQAKPGEAAPPVTPAPEAAAPSEPVPPSALASNLGAAGAPAATAPQMIGDFFGMSTHFTGLGPILGGEGSFPVSNASAGIGGGDRKFKIVEANSPIPVDRFFFNYHFFDDPLTDIAGAPRDLNRYTFGLEKTFHGGMSSVEVRVPFTNGYNSTQSILPGSPLAAAEFSDVSLALKHILTRNDHFITSAGLGMTLPTGPDWSITDSLGPLVNVKDDAFHLQPFLGAVWFPNDRLFVEGFTQIDFDTNGNGVFMRPFDTASPALDKVGVFQEQTLMFFDVAMGYWIYRDPCARLIKGIAPVIELHYSTTLDNEDFVVGPQGFFGASPQFQPVETFNRRDLLSLTGGVHLAMGQCSTLTLAGVVPLRSGTNRDYDAEFALQFVRRF